MLVVPLAARAYGTPGGLLVRWLLFIIGLAIAAAGIYALVDSGRFAAADPPLDDIDSASRARLEEVLRKADAEESRP